LSRTSVARTRASTSPGMFMPQRGKMRKPRATPWDTRPPCDPSPERAACPAMHVDSHHIKMNRIGNHNRQSTMVMVGFSYRPFQALRGISASLPRALPWAFSSCPFGAENRWLQIAAFSQIDPLAVGLGVAPRASYTTCPFALRR